MINVALIGSRASVEEGGLAYSIPKMKSDLNSAKQVRAEIFAPGERTGRSGEFGDAITSKMHFGNSIRYAAGLVKDICKFKADIIDIQGLWTYHNIAGVRAARQLNVPYIVTPRGMLDSWSLGEKQLKKNLALALYQKKIISAASAIRVTSQRELEHFHRLCLNQNVFLIPNSFDEDLYTGLTDYQREKTVIFLSRIHPKKGIKELLEAWPIVKAKEPEWKLKIYGDYRNKWGSEYRRLSKDIASDIYWMGPVYGQEKAKVFREAGLFILPTFSENFSNVLMEALVNKLPVVTTLGASWGNVEELGLGWICETNSLSISAAILNGIRSGYKRRQLIGAFGRQYVEMNFSMEQVTMQLTNLYNDLV